MQLELEEIVKKATKILRELQKILPVIIYKSIIRL